MKTYPLSLSRNYVAKWGVAEAIRELIQNALDSDSPFTYLIEPDADGTHALSLCSAQITLPANRLLLGKTDKGQDAQQIGQFGEGFKLALLVLTRLDRPVVIRNGVFTWTPTFAHSTTFDDEILVVNETPWKANNLDLIFEVYGLTDDDLAEVTRSCLLMQSDHGAKIETPRGEILLDRPGHVYVGNLFVSKSTMKYGYNFQPRFMPLERDRQTVSQYHLQDTVCKMWYSTGDWDRMARMMDDEFPDVMYAAYDTPEELRAACYALFRKSHPDSLVANSQPEADRLEALGKRRVVRVNASMYAAISGYGPYVGSVPTMTVMTPTERLQDFLTTYGDEMSSEMQTEFETILSESEAWALK